MKKSRLLIVLILVLTLILNACTKSSRFKINTKENRVEIKFHRFDKDLLSLDTSNIKPGVLRLYKQYPQFFEGFTYNILDTAATDTSAVCQLIHDYLTDKTYSPANIKAKKDFGDISDIETQVSDAYTYIHHYFPEVQLPQVYLFISGFNRQVMLNDKFIAFGTDFYLGNDFPLYKKLTYQYMIYNMKKENLAADIVSTTLFRMFVMNPDQDRLLDNMLFRGKIMYLISVFMPNEKSEILMGYSPEQWQWSKKFEKQIWTSIIDQKHLFSTEALLISKYMNEAPFTAPISQESPGRLGTFIGWQIINSYMTKNKDVDLKSLMNDENYQKILELSGYKPEN